MKKWHTLSSAEVINLLGSSEHGLSQETAHHRLLTEGPNQLQEAPAPSSFELFVRQFLSPLIYVLLGAFLVALLLGKRLDAGVIALVILANAIIGYLQERRAEAALGALRRLTAPKATVLRENTPLIVDAQEVVRGDILILAAGDRVGADARVIQAAELEIDESVLTGESLPVSKSSQHLIGDDLPLGDRKNMAYLNTVVTRGRGLAVVVATGMQTEMGRIAGDIAAIEAKPPLVRHLEKFGRITAWSVLGIAVFVLGLGVLRGLNPVDMFFVALSMAVSAIPEGLPIVVTVLLAVGVWRMARCQALVRHLPAVEALGGATVIATDKTGTLTLNRMTVREIWLPGRRYHVSGEGYSPLGAVYAAMDTKISPEEDLGLARLLEAAVLCNDASLREEAGQWTVVGDPTEGALLALAAKRGITPDWERIEEVPFTSQRRWMATLHRLPDGREIGFIKGALERVMARSTSSLAPSGEKLPLDPAKVEQAFQQLSGEALRVLALGVIQNGDLERGEVTLLGMVGMLDPPRNEAIEAVKICQEAGIKVVMITGDHANTARAIAEHLGILALNEEVFEGIKLERLSTQELAEKAQVISVYARVEPEHKLKIVKALQEKGQIVAMTGDGVNDAPALSQADIGVAMGSGTEVAKGASDMVLADDNFATLVVAVKEGRLIAENLKKVLRYLLGTNSGEVLLLTTSLLLGLPLPIIAVQILWINLVTDGTFDKALAMEPPERDLMRRPPYQGAPWDRGMVIAISLVAVLMTIGTLGVFSYALQTGPLVRAQTMAFSTIVFFQWFSAFAFRSLQEPLPKLAPNRWMWVALAIAAVLHLLVIYLPVLQVVFRTAALGWQDLGICLLVSSSLLILGELRKALIQGAPTSSSRDGGLRS